MPPPPTALRNTRGVLDGLDLHWLFISCLSGHLPGYAGYQSCSLVTLHWCETIGGGGGAL